MRPGATVRAVPGTIVLHTCASTLGRSVRAFRLDRTGPWVDIAEHPEVEWAIAIRRRVRELIAARERPLCVGHTA